MDNDENVDYFDLFSIVASKKKMMGWGVGWEVEGNHWNLKNVCDFDGMIDGNGNGGS